MKQTLLAATMLAATMFVAGGVAAPAMAQTAADVGHTLTPLGAVKAGNADGTIPAWTGGLTTASPGYVPGAMRKDPFAGEKPTLVINAQNVDRYASKLAEGTIAMIRTLPGYHVDVFPTHRTGAAPQFIYDNAIANAGARISRKWPRRGGRQAVHPVPHSA